MTEGYDIQALAAEVAEVVQRHSGDRERVEAIKPLLARWMEKQEGLRPEHRLPCDPSTSLRTGGRAHSTHSASSGQAASGRALRQGSGQALRQGSGQALRQGSEQACGHLLYEAEDGSFFIISVVFPPGTSSGVHYHGAWGVIGVLEGEDEETKYARRAGPADVEVGQECQLEKTGVYRFLPGSVSHLLPPEEGFHRVRAAAEVPGVSLHILGGTPETHLHFLCESTTRKLVDFPMRALLA